MTGLDVEAARKVLLDSLPPRDPKWRIWVDGILERLAPCVTDDPRIEAIRDLCDANVTVWGDTVQANLIEIDRIRAILDGRTP